MAERKSTCVAYLLLVFGGFAGLHLLYLRRDTQAFIYWCTFGGYFGIGPFRDLWRLPTYVKEANSEEKYMSSLSDLIRRKKKPPFSVVRFVAQILIGNSWCYLLMAAVPEEPFYASLKPLKLLGPLAAAVGVWLIGNIGREKSSFKHCLLGAYSVLPFSHFDPHVLNWSCVTTTLLNQLRGKSWRRTPLVRRSLCRRVLYLSMGWTLFCSLWVSYIYFNAEISKDGVKTKMRDAIHNFFKSPMFLEFKKNCWKLYEDTREHGFSQAWTNLIELLDPTGEHHALKVLGLKKGASQEEISSRYKELSKQWHPDKHKLVEEKETAQAMFIEIAQAYEVLSEMKRRRKLKHKQQ